jgi:hypothetical protein
VLSAAHCFEGIASLDSFQVMVGEHDITTGAESAFTKSYKIDRVVSPPQFSKGDADYDIAIVFTREAIAFDFGVSASCLPFK